MTKDSKYYPCNDCRYKRIANSTHCPFSKRRMCSLYNACDALTDLADSKEQFHDIPVELIIDVLRNNGYSGELRQTKIVNI